jgi:hypothetical protein
MTRCFVRDLARTYTVEEHGSVRRRGISDLRHCIGGYAAILTVGTRS